MSIPFKPGDQVAVYVRDSGGESQELSTQQQLTAFHKFCAENGCIPGAVFVDEARPGSTTVGREGFNAMIDHFRHGAPEKGLVIWSFSRFAREFDDAAFYRADLRRRGYILHSLNDSIPEGTFGRLYEAILDWKNQQFLSDLSADIKSGLRAMVVQYGALPGVPPRGFVRVPVEISTHRDGKPRIVHRWEPDPALTPVVQRAFAMLLSGAALIDIQRATGLYHSINSWATFFSNPLYKGELHYGDLIIQNYCAPMVDDVTWSAAQAIIHKRSKHQHLSGTTSSHPRRVSSHYLLSGLVFCARCGSPLSGSSMVDHRSNGETYNYQQYMCARRRRNRNCDAPNVPRVWLEETVLALIGETLLAPENLAAHQAELVEVEAERQSELSMRTDELRSQIGNIRRRIANITETLAESGKSRALLEKLSSLELEETDYLAEMAVIERYRPIGPLTQDRLVELSRELRNNLRKQDVLRGIVDKINVNREGEVVHLEIVYFFPEWSIIMPTLCFSVGAPGCRHKFIYCISAKYQRWQRH